MEAEGEAVFRAETEAAGSPNYHSLMDWTSKTSNDAYKHKRCNI